MKTPFASPAEPTAAGRPVLVWDAPVRVFHWLMVMSFAGAYLTAESERWRLVHVTLGYTLAGLVVFRLLWGVWGTHPARFRSFVRGPQAVWRYLASLLRGQPEHHTGHNPAGALAVIGLLGLGVLVTATGWLTYNDLVGHWAEELHEGAANTMLALVLLHIGAVIVSSFLHRENLVRAMVTGRKRGRPDEAAPTASRTLALVLLVAVLAFWGWQWQTAAASFSSGAAPTGAAPTSTARSEKHHDDDD